VNFLEAVVAATANRPVFRASGSDTNIGIEYQTKAAGVHLFRTDFDKTQFLVAHTASAVNYLQATGSATGNNVSFSAAGTDANIGIDFASKGFGSLRFFTGGNRQFNIADTASAVNYLQVTGGATGVFPVLSVQGSDANTGMVLRGKGTGGFSFQNDSGASQFFIASTASAVNYLEVKGVVTGSAPSISSLGSDTNIDLALTPKGTGRVRFGTLTATSDVAITGYIEIKDSAGNVRKLAVIS